MRRILLLMLVTVSLLCAQTSVPTLDAEVAVDTGNGFGSVGAYARRFANVDVNVGTAITYADSSTDGATFTINVDGVYAISYTEFSGYGDTYSISLNSSASSGINSLTVANRLCTTSVPVGYLQNCATTLGLSNGDVIRAHRSSSTAATDASSYVRFVVTRVR